MRQNTKNLLILGAVVIAILIFQDWNFKNNIAAQQQSSEQIYSSLRANYTAFLTDCESLKQNLGDEAQTQEYMKRYFVNKSFECYESLNGCVNNLAACKTATTKAQQAVPPVFDTVKTFMDTHAYSSSYDCVNYSNDLVKLLRSQGYDAHSVTGYDANGGYHEWVRLTLDIEPQKAKILTSADGYRFMAYAD